MHFSAVSGSPLFRLISPRRFHEVSMADRRSGASALYSIAFGMVLLPIVGYSTRRLYGSAWGMAAAAAIPALIIAMPHVLLAAKKVRAELKWRRVSRRSLRNRTRGTC
jgi:hypothetical protein